MRTATTARLSTSCSVTSWAHACSTRTASTGVLISMHQTALVALMHGLRVLRLVASLMSLGTTMARASTCKSSVLVNAHWSYLLRMRRRCNGLNIERCGLDGSSCTFVEYCAKGCFDTGHGALCVDRASARARDDVETSATASFKDIVDWRNTRHTT